MTKNTQISIGFPDQTNNPSPNRLTKPYPDKIPKDLHTTIFSVWIHDSAKNTSEKDDQHPNQPIKNEENQANQSQSRKTNSQEKITKEPEIVFYGSLNFLETGNYGNHRTTHANKFSANKDNNNYQIWFY